MRRSTVNPLDFSIILLLEDSSGDDLVLRRHNGAHASRHTNHWEKRRGSANAVVPLGFHIHYATQRYQEEGLRIDGYAEATANYTDFESALDLMINDAGFEVPNEGPQLKMSI